MGRRPKGPLPDSPPGAGLPVIGGVWLLKERAYHVLREAILRLDLKPGEPLTERVLSERLGVSKSPIRDALIRLEQEGLARSSPFRGFEVARLTEADMRNVFRFREAMELYSVEAFIEQGPPAHLAEIEATHAEQGHLLEASDRVRAYEDSRFHQVLVGALENPIFTVVARAIQAQVRRIQNLASTIPGRLEKTHQEHDRILQAIRARDVGTSREAMRRHIRSVLEDTLASDQLRRVTAASGSPPTCRP